MFFNELAQLQGDQELVTNILFQVGASSTSLFPGTLTHNDTSCRLFQNKTCELVVAGAHLSSLRCSRQANPLSLMEGFSWEVLCDATDKTFWRVGLGKAGSGYTRPRTFSE